MIFVTGGTGMVGAHLLLQLTRNGKKVRALRRAHSDMTTVRKCFAWYNPDDAPLFDTIEWVEGNILDRESLRSHLSDVDQIYHAAARVSFDPREREVMINDNVEGTINLTELALELGIRRFCHVSSIAALGYSPDGIAINEEASWSSNTPHSSYSLSKFLSETEVWRAIYQGLEAVIVNPSVILGPGNWEQGSPRFIKTIDKGLKFYTSGGTGFVGVTDVVSAMITLMEHPQWEQIRSNRYILNSENLSYRDLFNTIADQLGKPRPKYEAGKITMQLAWRVLRFTSLFTGTAPTVTSDTARSSTTVTRYDGSKIAAATGFSYRPVGQAIEEIAAIYKRDCRPGSI